jgi:uncharacterized protein (TIGR03435 family)
MGNKRVRYLAHSMSVDKLLQILAGSPSRPYVERPIVDQTGLASKLDFVLEFTPPAQSAAANDRAPMTHLRRHRLRRRCGNNWGSGSCQQLRRSTFL